MSDSMVPSLTWRTITQEYESSHTPAAPGFSMIVCAKCLSNGMPTGLPITFVDGTAYCQEHVPLL